MHGIRAAEFAPLGIRADEKVVGLRLDRRPGFLFFGLGAGYGDSLAARFHEIVHFLADKKRERNGNERVAHRGRPVQFARDGQHRGHSAEDGAEDDQILPVFGQEAARSGDWA